MKRIIYKTRLVKFAASVALLFGMTSDGRAATVTSYADMPGGTIYPVNQGIGDWLPFSVLTGDGAVQVTTSAEHLSTGVITSPALVGSFQYLNPIWIENGWTVTNPSVAPGDLVGRHNPNHSLILDFDTPLAAFGATFLSAYSGGGKRGVDLTAYSGPGGTGTLLGLVSTPDNVTVGVPPPHVSLAPIVYPLFAGVIAEGTPIQSIVITPRSASDGYYLDTLVFVVPEPSAFALVAVGGIALLRVAKRASFRRT